MNYHSLKLLFVSLLGILLSTLSYGQKHIVFSGKAQQLLKNKQILYVERQQYVQDHHNTATMFMKGEVNQAGFRPRSALRIFDVDTRSVKTLLECPKGVLRDPELSFDAKKIVFSMRKDFDDGYHIYEINVDGSGLKQLTFAPDVADIDPLYLPDGSIIFSSSRQPKYCMCNRHIMANLYKMSNDGANINQIGVSTLFEGHSSLMSNGTILYDRWEYVDRNFGDAQGLWTVNPDGTKHQIYYGNNTKSPGAVIDGRQIPGTDLVVCIFSSCHERPWGALAVIDRKKGVDGEEPLLHIMPSNSRSYLKNGDLDSFKWLDYYVEDPYPIDKDNFLVSRTIWHKNFGGWSIDDAKQAIYMMGMDGTNEILFEGDESLFDPMIIEPREAPIMIPENRNYKDKDGVFYVQNVYEGTHIQGVEKGSIKYLRVIESPEKRTWTLKGWGGQGEQAPGMNWHSFENKRILGEVPIEEDGSVSFKVPAGKYVYFQLLDKNKRMIQSMRSGTMLMGGETNGCIGCHEDRLQAPLTTGNVPVALKKSPQVLQPWMGKAPFKFSYIEQVQPILDKHCLKCHDFDQNNREKLVLAADKNMFFNASYVNLYVRKSVKLIGGGPAEIQPAYSWGSNVSKLTEIINNGHGKVKLSDKEKQTLYTWMDINGVYYPVYESSFDNTMAGRSPLNDDEVAELGTLTNINFGQLNNWQRNIQAQIAFDRPEKSPCLDAIRGDKQKYDRALEIIKIGQKRLKETPRGDIESQLVVCERLKQQLEKYNIRLEEEIAYKQAIANGEKRYDK